MEGGDGVHLRHNNGERWPGDRGLCKECQSSMLNDVESETSFEILKSPHHAQKNFFFKRNYFINLLDDGGWRE